MIFVYSALDQEGVKKDGTIEAISLEVAISSLQRRGFVISSIHPETENKNILSQNFTIFESISNKEVVILSRQMATLFEAQVSALRIFRLLGAESENKLLGSKLNDIAEALQGGSAISAAMAKHPDVFSDFYVNMVKSGEESGKLDQTFIYLADYLDRNYEVSSKAKNALIYPAFVIFTFFAVMILMLTIVIPKISGILKDSGQAIPVYTQVVIAISNFLIDYGLFFAVGLVIAAFGLFQFLKSDAGKESFDHFKLDIPAVGSLYRKLYLSRIADNMNSMLTSGIPMVRVLEITKDVVDNHVFKSILDRSIADVRGGMAVSESFTRQSEGQIPGIMTQMIKIGEETGNLGSILATLAKFYQREVINAVDTLVGLIEPIMIVALGLGVGILLASVLIPIYNISSTF